MKLHESALFHVQKLAHEAVQDMRVKSSREVLDEKSVQIEHEKACGKTYHAPVFENWDSRKLLLTRSIYKKESLWTESQRIRADILFRQVSGYKESVLSFHETRIYLSPVQTLGCSLDKACQVIWQSGQIRIPCLWKSSKVNTNTLSWNNNLLRETFHEHSFWVL